MARFIHLTPEARARRVRISGVKAHRLFVAGVEDPRGVFAFPVLRNFVVTHQWLRELKRGGQRTFMAVHFLIPDGEPVFVGHYATKHKPMTAAEAAGFLGGVDEPEGYQVIVPRKIEAGEIKTIRAVPQGVGWRYFPKSHGRKPCGCPICLTRGEMKSRKVRERWQKLEEG